MSSVANLELVFKGHDELNTDVWQDTQKVPLALNSKNSPSIGKYSMFYCIVL